MPNIKIIVATHKKYQMPTDNMYLPLHVGREGKEDLGYVGDNSGINISKKNSSWCELTGLYWAWKNLNCDYLGLVQYRRHFMKKRKGGTFDSILTKEEAEQLLNKADIVVPKHRNYLIMNLEEHFNGYDFTIDSDIDNIRKAIHDVSPEYDGAFNTVMRRKIAHMFNMFIMKKTLVDQFCEWEFSVLEYFEKLIGPNRGRLVGYVAEQLIDVWIEKNGYSYIECDVVYMDSKNNLYRKIDYLCRKFGIKHRFIKV